MPTFRAFVLAHANIYPIYELREPEKQLVLKSLSCRTSMTQGNNSLSESTPSEHSVLMMKQKPEASNQTNPHFKGHLQVKLFGQKGELWHIP